MKYFIAVLALLSLAACGTVNPFVAGSLNKASADYASAKANLQKIDDAQLQATVDQACAVRLGALQRAESTSGNPNVTRAMLMLCPVNGVGVTSVLPTGNISVQTTNVPPKP